MNIFYSYIVFILLFHSAPVFFCQNVNSGIKDGLYTFFSGFPCVLYLNQTSKIGCESPRVRGVPIEILGDQELEEILSIYRGFDIIPMIPLEMLDRIFLDKVSKNDFVKGILVTSPKNITQIHSHLQTCPDCGPFVNRDWNPMGTGLIHTYIPLPVFAIFSSGSTSNSNAAELLKVAQFNKGNFSSSNHLYGIELDLLMHASKNAEVCLRRNQCRPLVAQSIYTNITTNSKSSPNVTILTTRLDSRTLFEGLSLGLYDSLSGIFSLLLLVDAIAKSDPTSLDRNYIFTFFDGEMFDHMGSSAFLNDLQFFQCNNNSTKSCPYYKNPACKDPCRPDTNFTYISWERLDTILDINYIDEAPIQVLQRGNTKGILPSPLLSFLKAKPSLNYTQWTTLNEVYPSTFATLDVWNPTDIWKQRVCEISESVLTSLSISTSVNCSLIPLFLDGFKFKMSTKDVLGGSLSARVETLGSFISSVSCHPSFCSDSTCYCVKPHLYESIGSGLSFEEGKKWVVKDARLPHWVQSDWGLIGMRIGFSIYTTTYSYVEFAISLFVSMVTFVSVWRFSKLFK